MKIAIPVNGIGGKLWVVAPPITHNPWHPAYELTLDARNRIEKELAHEWLAEAREKHPGQPITVVIDDRVMAGFVPLVTQ